MMSDDIYLRMIEDIEDYAILLLDREGNVMSWNKGAEKIKGYTQEEAIGKNFRIFYTKADQDTGLPEQLMHDALINNKSVYEGWRVRKDGTHFWGSIVINAIYDEQKSLIGFIKLTRDLTEKKLYDEQLLQFNQELQAKVQQQTITLYKNERRFRALVENNYEAISLRDINGHILYQSQGAERLSGYSKDEMALLPQSAFFHPDDIVGLAERIRNSLQHPGKPIHGIHRIRHKAGHYLWLEGTITNMLQDEHVQAIVGNFRDITERKMADEKLIQANRLYAFVSAINQTIVHVTDKQLLFKEACRIAVEIGKFEMAWVGIPDIRNATVLMHTHYNATETDQKLLNNMQYGQNGPTATVLRTGKHYAINSFDEVDIHPSAKDHAKERGFKSYIVLPIKRSGITFATLNLNSLHHNFFDEREIQLLEEIVGDISFALDVFDKEEHRRAMAAKVAHSEQRLKQAQAIAHFGSWELNFTDGVGIWSEEACRIYGLDTTHNTQTYEQWLSYIHPEDVDHVLKITRENADNANSFAFFHRIRRKDGEVRHVYSQAEKEMVNGIPVGLYGVVHDLTGMKTAEDALQQTATNLNVILDLIPQAVFVKNYDGKFIYANKNFAAIYGRLPEQLIDRTLKETLPENNDPLHFLQQDRNIIDTGITETIPEVTINDHSGRSRIFFTIKVPYTVPGTNEKAVLGISQDITEVRQIESERTQMVSDIIQRNKDLEQFSYIVSHNLRAPVANIIGLTDLFHIMEHDPKEERIMMHELSISVNKLDGVIRDLNHILQIRNQVNEHKELVNFSELVADIEVSIQILLKNEDVQIVCAFGDAPQIFSIKSYIYSIFFNLISNSIKYHRPGVRPVINISSRNDANGLELTFTDNGLGIDLQRQGQYLFGLYKRFHDHVEGKGIGLYMVKAQVEALSGRISVESEINKGTTFRIVF